VEIIIGIKNVPRELSISSDVDADKLQATVAAVLEKGTGVLTLADDLGRTTIVPANAIGFVQIGPTGARRVGFGG